MNSKSKAKLVTVALFVFVVMVCANVVALWPSALPWVLGAFAVPGAWKFCRVMFLWLTTEDKPITIRLPKVKKERKAKTYADYAREAGR